MLLATLFQLHTNLGTPSHLSVWDTANRLIITTFGSNVSRVYSYSQDGDLTRAEVAGLVTTFAYDGNGSRLQMSVAGETTTYLPDYGSRSNRVLFEQGAAESKQYLYGVACLGEFVTDNATNDTEWRYYQRDAKSLVRQTTNEAATITLAWTFSPEGGVLLGEEGPVTHLGCGDDAVYDWSTGLIFKSGGYFDPSLGIWLTMGGAIIWHNAIPGSRRKRKRKDKKRRWVLIVLLLLVVLTLTACQQPPTTPEPTQTATCTPEPVSIPSPTETLTPWPTDPIGPPEPEEPVPSKEPTPEPSETPEPTLPPTDTPSPAPTPTKKPSNLPTPPTGWDWKFVSSKVRTTQYSTDKLDSDRFNGVPETPYDANDQPITEFGQLPHDFLEQVAYQGSGILPTKDLIQYAKQASPIKQGAVPYRYYVTRKDECGGFPKAGNGTCAVPDKTGAVGWPEKNQLVPVGSKVFIVELNLGLKINDTGLGVGNNQIDIYTGFENNPNYYRENLEVWRLVGGQ